ncbi:MAG: hypothetical protein AB2L07_12850, partial [Thermoanaerobaculaceae bacterium]
MDLSATWERMQVHGDRLFTATIAQSTVAYQLTTRAMLRAILQLVDCDYNTALYTDGRGSERRALLHPAPRLVQAQPADRALPRLLGRGRGNAGLLAHHDLADVLRQG